MIHNNLTEAVVQDVTNNMNPYFGSQELRALLRSLDSLAGMDSGGSDAVLWSNISGVPTALTSAQAAGTPSIRAIGTTATTAAAGNHNHAISSLTGTATIAQLPTGTSATTVALGNHTHTASAITATAIGPGTATNVQGILAELAARIAALEAA